VNSSTRRSPALESAPRTAPMQREEPFDPPALAGRI
jgi:hypothetical protein